MILKLLILFAAIAFGQDIWSSLGKPEDSIFYWKNSFSYPHSLNEAVFWVGQGQTQTKYQGVLLTSSDSPNSYGTWTNTQPLNGEEFEIRFAFSMGSDRPKGGQGIVLWIVKNYPQEGDFYGFSRVWDGLALVIDTEKETPIIYAIQNKNNFEYGGNWAQHSLGSCTANIRSDKKKVAVLLHYKNGKLKVAHDISVDPFIAEPTWTDCFQSDVQLETGKNYLAISSSAGFYPDNHLVTDLVTWGLGHSEKQNQQEQVQVIKPVLRQDPNSQQDHQQNQQQEQLIDPVLPQETNTQQDRQQYIRQQPTQNYQQQAGNQQHIQQTNPLIQRIEKRFAEIEQLHDNYLQDFDTRLMQSVSKMDVFTQNFLTRRSQLESGLQTEGTFTIENDIRNFAREFDRVKNELSKLEDIHNVKQREIEKLIVGQQELTEKLEKSANNSGGYFWTVLIILQVIGILIYFKYQPQKSHRLQNML